LAEYNQQELLRLTKPELLNLAKKTNLRLSMSMTKAAMIEELLSSPRTETKTKTLNCPDCGSAITMNQSFDEWRYYECPDCGCLVDESIPSRLHIIEALHFLKNNALLLIIPVGSGFCFELYPDWRIISGLLFCLSLSILSIAYHEFFHAITAYLLGDFTIYAQGYLRLNIVLYFNNFTSLIMPLALFVFYGVFLPGAAVYITPKYLRRPLYMSLVSLSGVMANALILLLILFLVKLEPFAISQTFMPLVQVMAFIQIAIIIFNLIPIPGLDGWNAISPVFDPRVKAFFEKFAFIFIIIFVGSIIMFSDASNLLGSIMIHSVESIGLDLNQIFEGWQYLKIFDDGECRICSFISQP
jgi:Zn-dependent protease